MGLPSWRRATTMPTPAYVKTMATPAKPPVVSW
jgi:hypothetical protein